MSHYLENDGVRNPAAVARSCAELSGVTRRSLSAVLLFCAVVMAGGYCGGARAENFPTRLIRIIVPFAAGGVMDVLGRPLADELQQRLGVSVVIENRPGANGITGSEAVAKSDPDGYTVLLTTGSLVGNAVFNPSQLRYDPLADFRPIAGFYDEKGDGLVLVASKELKAKKLADLLQIGRERPEGLTFAHAGIGNITQVAGDLLRYHTNVKMLGVPFRGTIAAVPELTAGRIDFLFGDKSALKSTIDGGQVELIATTGRSRLAAFPEIPTLLEAGYADFVLVGYLGLYVPARTPDAVVAKLHQAVVASMASAKTRSILGEAGLSNSVVPPDEFAAFLRADFAKQKKLVDVLKLKVN